MLSTFTSSFSYGKRKPPVVGGWGGVSSGLVFNLLTAPSSGTTWTDSSGGGYNATLNGSTTYVSNNGGGIRLNNASAASGTGYISVPYNFNSNTFTVDIVASFNPSFFWATIWGNDYYNATRGFMAYMLSANQINFGSAGGATVGLTGLTPTSAIKQWTFVRNGTTNTIYSNATQVATGTAANPFAFHTGNLYFGARHTNSGTGTTDFMNNTSTANQPVFYQMRVYSTALSSSDVTTNYNAVKTLYGI